MSTLSAHNVSVELAGSSILSNASFSVRSGELVGLIGPNGAGKTTLLRAMIGLLRVQHGTVAYDDVEFDPKHRTELAKNISYLEQNCRSFWPLTVENIVMLGRLPHLRQWQKPSAADYDFVRSAMVACDVEQFSERLVTKLSGGEQARVMLARALATCPHILLADEPVSGLDPAHQLAVMDKLRELADNGTGIVVVMHDLTLASRYCDRMSLLFEGRVVAQGKAETVLTQEQLAKVYGIEAMFNQSEQGTFIVPLKRLVK